MRNYDRRNALLLAGGAAVASLMPQVAHATMVDRLRAAQIALKVWRAAFERWRVCERPFDVVEVATNDGIYEEFLPRPPTLNYYAARDRAREAVEAAFMTTPQSVDDEVMVMSALDLYREVAPSAFALQTARDLFTPKQFQTYPHKSDRDWLLNEPDETFAKAPVPDFLWRVRAQHRLDFI